MTSLYILQADAWSANLDRLGELGRGTARVALDLVIATAVMLVGWAIAALLSRLVRVMLHRLRFDDGVRSLVGARVLGTHEPARIASWATYWLVLTGAGLLALEALGMSVMGSIGARLGEVVPSIITSALLFAAGSVIAMVVGSLTRRFLETAEIRAARVHGQIVTGVLTGFAALLALEQLGFAAQFVMAIGVVATGAAGLALALAFGLGCRDLARDFLVEYLRSLDDERVKRPE